ncbi:hypothetical protein SAMN04487881_2718 [Marinobacter sp. es.048]|uniref:hypothetical protein n=1 Tax=Marinobacter sp. es.048 TaxID=1761795 RepID=UPI000B58C7F9|nr:hypothetical protein [Marinobacter sp. es.048]SNC75091.1 hypothetical protein SAMN04487881_2718 [Marinobacter sp. es.048]
MSDEKARSENFGPFCLWGKTIAFNEKSLISGKTLVVVVSIEALRQAGNQDIEFIEYLVRLAKWSAWIIGLENDHRDRYTNASALGILMTPEINEFIKKITSAKGVTALLVLFFLGVFV